MPGTSNSSSVTSSSSSSSMSVRLILTCLAIVIVFTLCWVPVQSALFLLSVGFSRPSNILRWLTIFSCFNSCVNPIIYGLMWRPFRAALRDVSAVYKRKQIANHCPDATGDLLSVQMDLLISTTNEQRLATRRMYTYCCQSISRRCAGLKARNCRSRFLFFRWSSLDGWLDANKMSRQVKTTAARITTEPLHG